MALSTVYFGTFTGGPGGGMEMPEHNTPSGGPPSTSEVPAYHRREHFRAAHGRVPRTRRCGHLVLLALLLPQRLLAIIPAPACVY
jgi:hypothetical protein